MDSIGNWLQNWSDACQYARECAPDFATFPVPDGEPFTALAAITGLCYLLWARNERRIRLRPRPTPAAQIAQRVVGQPQADHRRATPAVAATKEKLAA
jgi:hypothetical protein